MKRKITISVVFTLFVLALCLACCHAKAGTPAGVWYQPTSSFQKWKSQGVTTLVGYEWEGGSVSVRQWCDAADAWGLDYWLQYNLSTILMKDRPHCVGFINPPDEPDGVGNVPATTMQQQYAAIKAQTKKPVAINLDGGKMRWRVMADYEAYVLAADEIWLDYYPLNGGNGPADIVTIGKRLDYLASIAPGKPRKVFIECCDQNLRVQNWLHDPANQPTGAQLAANMRGPTPTEMWQQVKLALDHGASGIFWFPQRIGNGWEGFDGRTDAQAGAMEVIDQWLAGR